MLRSIFHKKRIEIDSTYSDSTRYKHSLFSNGDPFDSLLYKKKELKINSHKAEQLRNLQNYHMPAPIIEKVKEENPFNEMKQEEINEYIIEFKKYLAIIVLIQGNDKTRYVKIAMMNNLVDEIWHNFILFSEEYCKFSDMIFGKYLHHYPYIKQDIMVDDSKKKFLFYYRKYFERLNPIWKFKYTNKNTLRFENYKKQNNNLLSYPIFNNIPKHRKNEDLYYGFFNYTFIISHDLEYDWENESYLNNYWNSLNAYTIFSNFEDTITTDKVENEDNEIGDGGCGGCGGCGG